MKLKEQYKASFAYPTSGKLTDAPLRENNYYIVSEYELPTKISKLIPLLKREGLIDNNQYGLKFNYDKKTLSTWKEIDAFYCPQNKGFDYINRKHFVYKVIFHQNAEVKVVNDFYTLGQFPVYKVELPDKLKEPIAKTKFIVSWNYIKDIKLIGSIYWYDEEQHKAKNKNKTLSRSAIKDIEYYCSNWGADLYDREEFKNFRVNNPIKVYRGISIHDNSRANTPLNIDKLKNLHLFETKKFKFDKATSWTTNFAVAERFMFYHGKSSEQKIRMILSTIANKNNSLLDLRAIKIATVGYEEFEIILKNTILDCKVVHKLFDEYTIKRIK